MVLWLESSHGCLSLLGQWLYQVYGAQTNRSPEQLRLLKRRSFYYWRQIEPEQDDLGDARLLRGGQVSVWQRLTWGRGKIEV